MDFETEMNELSSEIMELQTKENKIVRQKEVLSIINELNKIKIKDTVCDNAILFLPVSKQGMDEFITLLDTSEYIKATGYGEMQYDDKHKRREDYDYYLLTIGNGIVLEFTLAKYSFVGYHELRDLPRESHLNCYLYNHPERVSLNVIQSREFPMVNLVGTSKDENVEFDNSCEELKFNTKDVSEKLCPISFDDLIKRYNNRYQKTGKSLELN